MQRFYFALAMLLILHLYCKLKRILGKIETEEDYLKVQKEMLYELNLAPRGLVICTVSLMKDLAKSKLQDSELKLAEMLRHMPFKALCSEMD